MRRILDAVSFILSLIPLAVLSDFVLIRIFLSG